LGTTVNSLLDSNFTSNSVVTDGVEGLLSNGAAVYLAGPLRVNFTQCRITSSLASIRSGPGGAAGAVYTAGDVEVNFTRLLLRDNSAQRGYPAPTVRTSAPS
jgi:hypothetical protein